MENRKPKAMSSDGRKVLSNVVSDLDPCFASPLQRLGCRASDIRLVARRPQQDLNNTPLKSLEASFALNQCLMRCMNGTAFNR